MAAFVRNKLMMMMMMIASNVIFLPLLQAANMEYTYWQIVVYVLKKLCGESLLELWLCKTFISIFTYFCICIVCILLCAANGVINDDDDDIVLRHLYYTSARVTTSRNVYTRCVVTSVQWQTSINPICGTSVAMLKLAIRNYAGRFTERRSCVKRL